jgi:hypothetical protein
MAKPLASDLVAFSRLHIGFALDGSSESDLACSCHIGPSLLLYDKYVCCSGDGEPRDPFITFLDAAAVLIAILLLVDGPWMVAQFFVLVCSCCPGANILLGRQKGQDLLSNAARSLCH